MFGLFKKEKKSLNFLDNFVRGSSSKLIEQEDVYLKIAVAYACIEKIACQAESFKFYIKDKDVKREKHPLHKLLFERSLFLGGQSAFGQLIRNLLIYGEAYALRMPFDDVSRTIGKIQPIFSKDVAKNTRNQNVIASYFIAYGGQSINIPIDITSGYSNLLRISLYSSNEYNNGTSPLKTVNLDATLIQDIFKWNLTTLQKGVKPSGIFGLNSPVGASQQQINDLKQNISNLYSGSANANSGILLPNGVTYTPLQMNSQDMDFYNTAMLAMKNVAMAFQVPLPLLFSDSATLDNYKVAIEEFIMQTVIPLVEDIIGTFDVWYNTITGENIKTYIDLDSIDGLEGKREIKSKRMIEFVKNGILTPNEARIMLGYEKFNDTNADSLIMPSSLIPIELLGGGLMPSDLENDNE
jgi:HK97 family phage portal protein